METKKFDCIVIGVGPAGLSCALTLKNAGKNIAVIESAELGGTCLNRGCIPTTLLLNIGEFLKKIKSANTLGIEILDYKINFSKIIEYKNSVINIHRKGIWQTLKNQKISYFSGAASFIDEHTLAVAQSDNSIEYLSADIIIIATGAKPAYPAEFTNARNYFLTSENIMDLTEAPKRLAIIGAGVTGCEFAYFFNEIGTIVYLIDTAETSLPIKIDSEIHQIFIREIKKNKINTINAVSVSSYSIENESVLLNLSNGDSLAVDKVLLAIGRAGSIANLNLEKIGIKYNHKNFIETNEKYQTAQKHIYAIGDVAGKYLYAHTAAAEGKQVAEIIVGIRDNTKFNAVPFTIFTYPELAWCGLTEQEAIDKKINYKKSIYHLRGLGRAHTLGEISGLVKFIVDADTELIIGCHIIGARATELIHTVQLAMNNNLKISALAELIAAHPSMSEALMETARLIED